MHRFGISIKYWNNWDRNGNQDVDLEFHALFVGQIKPPSEATAQYTDKEHQRDQLTGSSPLWMDSRSAILSSNPGAKFSGLIATKH